ncbi:MAG TPA: ATP-binding protein [Anaerolineales bacterium]|jgi:serine/threonine-protein kinase RsbW|nr:ATP-binding protein [Anaerolineales bacterium]HRK89605.1 ATP-binding protein [Anaerolineales bacterium]
MPSYTFPAMFEFLDEIRDSVAQVAREGGFSEKAIYSLQLAADEAASNIIEHAYEGVSDGTLDLFCEMRDNEIVIILRDTGRPFDPTGVKEPNLSADLADRQVGGLGIYLMRKLMDSVHYETNPGTGNLLIMTKRRD